MEVALEAFQIWKRNDNTERWIVEEVGLMVMAWSSTRTTFGKDVEMGTMFTSLHGNSVHGAGVRRDMIETTRTGYREVGIMTRQQIEVGTTTETAIVTVMESVDDNILFIDVSARVSLDLAAHLLSANTAS